MSDPSAAVSGLISEGAARLRTAGIANPDRDARLLLAHHLGVPSDVVYPPYSHPQLLEAFHRELGAVTGFFDTIAARAQGRPVSKIIGVRAFWNYRFLVTDDVLDPRPETETLIERALDEPFDTVLDLGTGSGCILLTLLAERAEARGLGVDISDAALAVASENATRLDVADRAGLTRSDWFSDVTGLFDLIVSNPPYIGVAEMGALDPDVRDWEPRMALTDEGDGLSAYRAIAAGARDHLSPGGRLLVEIGPSQGAAVAGLFQAAGLEEIAVHPDMDGRDRVVAARRC